MKIEKYLTDSKISWRDLSPATKKAIEKLEDEFNGVNRLSELLDDVVEKVFEDGTNFHLR